MHNNVTSTHAWFGSFVLMSLPFADLTCLGFFLSSLQGTGRYAIYIANYASGNVGPHALIEMDESASDLSQGVIALSNVAEEAGVNKFTGECGGNKQGLKGICPQGSTCRFRSRFPPVKGTFDGCDEERH